ncbi:MAG TPA: hypothetical protein PLX79_01915 [Candidatus Dojkabacteria bacterium]|jgi:hypothetical protein|nr:hypothetical protein [Candidatus Dojkabacteria bacterium]
MDLSSQFKFTQVTLDEVFSFIKERISQGAFPAFRNYSDKQLLSVAMTAKPLIEVHLTIAGRLAQQQLEENKLKRFKVDKAMLSEEIAPSDDSSQCKA